MDVWCWGISCWVQCWGRWRQSDKYCESPSRGVFMLSLKISSVIMSFYLIILFKILIVRMISLKVLIRRCLLCLPIRAWTLQSSAAVLMLLAQNKSRYPWRHTLILQHNLTEQKPGRVGIIRCHYYQGAAEQNLEMRAAPCRHASLEGPAESLRRCWHPPPCYPSPSPMAFAERLRRAAQSTWLV